MKKILNFILIKKEIRKFALNLIIIAPMIILILMKQQMNACLLHIMKV